MPRTNVVFFREDDGSVPVVQWLDEIPLKAQLKCLIRLGRLEQMGFELRRPEADLLRDGIYELRIGLQGINYRILYFFHEQNAVVVSHGLTKEQRVPPADIDAAIERRSRFEGEPESHTFRPLPPHWEN